MLGVKREKIPERIMVVNCPKRKSPAFRGPVEKNAPNKLLTYLVLVLINSEIYILKQLLWVSDHARILLIIYGTSFISLIAYILIFFIFFFIFLFGFSLILFLVPMTQQ